MAGGLLVLVGVIIGSLVTVQALQLHGAAGQYSDRRARVQAISAWVSSDSFRAYLAGILTGALVALAIF